ncbi:MAG: diguanylate cyclase [Pleurocapsa sp.]
MKSIILVLEFINQGGAFWGYQKVDFATLIFSYFSAFIPSYLIYQKHYKKTVIAFGSFCLLSTIYGIICFLSYQNILNLGEKIYLNTPIIATLILYCIICATVVLKSQEINSTLNNKLASLIKQLTKETAAKTAAEQATFKLKTTLEDQVAKRTTDLDLANQDLQENNLLMDKVAKLTPNILYIYDLEKKTNIYANRFLAEVLGYSVAEIEQINLQVFDTLLHPDDRQLVEQHHQDCLILSHDDYLELEFRMQDRYGKWHWLQSKDTVFERDKTGKPTQILGVTQDITETKKIQSESARLNLELAEQIQILESWHKQRLKLAKMNEFLQACLTIQEAEMALIDLLQPLFPNTDGAVYLVNNSKNLLNAIAVWGKSNSKISFEPNECWSLRRGNAHISHPDTSGLYCSHIDCQTDLTPTLCLPMSAKGETLGMLYLSFNSSQTIHQSIKDLAETVAQNIAMSFANLKLQEKLRYQSLRDPLTGLYNRRYLQECLTKEIDRSQRKQQFIGIIMIDIDHFKRFNDVYGHSAGDLVLKEVGQYLLSQTRQYDLACRFGGEELVIVMPEASIEDTILRAEEVRSGVKQLKLEYQGQKLESISVSIGVSCFPDDSIDVDGLIQAADTALYEAKKQGRDCVRRC